MSKTPFRTNKKKNLLIGFAIVSLLFCCVNEIFAGAKTSDNSVTDETEIKALSEKFLNSFIATMAIENVSSELIEKDFVTRTATKSRMNSLEWANPERVIFVNNTIFLTVLSITRCTKDEIMETESPQMMYQRCMAPNLYSAIIKIPLIKYIFATDYSDSEESADYEQSEKDWEDLKALNEKLRQDILNNPPQKAKGFEFLKSVFYSYRPPTPCENSECYGLPENTEIATVSQMLMDLKIAKFDGKWKIFLVEITGFYD
ncbi:MAG: hypothetical protein ACK5NT_11000 [Pyrinomonadaceae bacterium]